MTFPSAPNPKLTTTGQASSGWNPPLRATDRTDDDTFDLRATMLPIAIFGAGDSNSPGLRQVRLARFLSRRSVQPVLQPMVDLADGTVVGHELLTRSTQAGTAIPPKRLFLLAESHGLAEDLSRRLRRDGLACAAASTPDCRIFLNTHPTEPGRPRRLLESLASLTQRYPALHLTLEIHERARLELDSYVGLRRGLQALGVGVAFDDFGSGRSRLLELSTAPPDYIKFARGMVRNVDRRSSFRRRILRPLVAFSRSLGAVPIAEGIETQRELAACREVGFAWAQGYYLGRPRTVGEPSSQSLFHHLVQKDAVG